MNSRTCIAEAMHPSCQLTEIAGCIRTYGVEEVEQNTSSRMTVDRDIELNVTDLSAV